MPQAVDYSWGRPGGESIAAAGYVGALRYLGDSSRDISHRELAELHAAGLPVAIIWETVADRAGHGYQAGVMDAGRANAYADALGWPADRPIYYAVDFDATPEQVGPYFDGVRQMPGRPVGIYGSYRIIEAYADLPFRWQCAAWSGNGAGSGGSIQGRRLSQHAHLFQRVGYVLNDTCDANDVLAADWGGWHPDIEQEDDDMGWNSWTAEDRTAMLNEVVQQIAGSNEVKDLIASGALYGTSGMAKADGKDYAKVGTNAGDLFNAIMAVGSGGGQVDVAKLADALRANLAAEVVDELRDRLAG